MRIGKQKQVNASYQASLVNRHIRRFTGVQYGMLRCSVVVPAQLVLKLGADLEPLTELTRRDDQSSTGQLCSRRRKSFNSCYLLGTTSENI